MASLMDSLPNEMILQIFSHSENLKERAVFSQVSKRFRSLSKVKTWRKRIYITLADIKEHRLYLLEKNALLQEAKLSKNLESLIIDDSKPLEKRTQSKFDRLLPQILCKFFKKCLKLNKVQCRINRGEKVEFSSKCDLFINDPIKRKYFKKMVNRFPEKFKKINHRGSQTLVTPCLDRSSDVLEELRCQHFTVNTKILPILKRCKKLKFISVTGTFKVKPGMELMDFPKLNLQNLRFLPNDVMPNLFHNHPKLLDMFMRDSLTQLYIIDHVLAGYEAIVLKKCKSLESLHIRMGSEHSLSDEERSNLLKNIVTILNQSSTMKLFHVENIGQRYINNFREEIIPLVQQYQLNNCTFYSRSAFGHSAWRSIIIKP